MIQRILGRAAETKSTNKKSENGTINFSNHVFGESLFLPYLELKDRDVPVILDFLEKNKYIKKLYLNWNKLSGNGVNALIDAKLNLKYLDLKHNDIREEGLRGLTLKKAEVDTVININKNPLTTRSSYNSMCISQLGMAPSASREAPGETVEPMPAVKFHY